MLVRKTKIFSIFLTKNFMLLLCDSDVLTMSSRACLLLFILRRLGLVLVLTPLHRSAHTAHSHGRRAERREERALTTTINSFLQLR